MFRVVYRTVSLNDAYRFILERLLRSMHVQDFSQPFFIARVSHSHCVDNGQAAFSFSNVLSLPALLFAKFLACQVKYVILYLESNTNSLGIASKFVNQLLLCPCEY